MSQTTKNENEYNKDGLRYVKALKACSCAEKTGDTYLLTCRMHQRGEHVYEWTPGTDWIKRPLCKGKFWLGESAGKTVAATVAGFEAALAEKESYRQVAIPEAGLTIFYRPAEEDYQWILQRENRQTGAVTTELPLRQGTDALLHRLESLMLWGKTLPEEVRELLLKPTAETLPQHPLVASAIQNGDDLLVHQIRLYYGLEAAADCESYAALLGEDILPPLPEEYNRSYAIDRETISPEQLALLHRSGYKLLHRAYFAMRGYTHAIVSLNPCTKVGVDAGKQGEEMLSFEEYLTLFE